MGASLNVRDLADQDLYDLFASADEHQDERLCQLCIDEITRRCQLSPTVEHEVPALLGWLPKGIWHTKPGGGGG